MKTCHVMAFACHIAILSKGQIPGTQQTHHWGSWVTLVRIPNCLFSLPHKDLSFCKVGKHARNWVIVIDNRFTSLDTVINMDYLGGCHYFI